MKHRAKRSVRAAGMIGLVLAWALLCPGCARRDTGGGAGLTQYSVGDSISEKALSELLPALTDSPEISFWYTALATGQVVWVPTDSQQAERAASLLDSIDLSGFSVTDEGIDGRDVVLKIAQGEAWYTVTVLLSGTGDEMCLSVADDTMTERWLKGPAPDSAFQGLEELRKTVFSAVDGAYCAEVERPDSEGVTMLSRARTAQLLALMGEAALTEAEEPGEPVLCVRVQEAEYWFEEGLMTYQISTNGRMEVYAVRDECRMDIRSALGMLGT